MKTYRKLRKWHRTLGVSSAIFVVILTITGLALNHTERLKLDQRFVGSSIWMDLYNISLPKDPSSFATKNHQVTLLADRLYFNATELEEQADQLFGAVELAGTVIVAISGEILLLEQDGQLIEKLTGSEGVPAGMERIGLSSKNKLIVYAAHGEYSTDLDTLEWLESPSTSSNIKWSTESIINEPLKAKLAKAYRGKGLSLERVLLDLHSGRILGSWGVYLVDAAALLFLILAITGVWMWSKTRKQ